MTIRIQRKRNQFVGDPTQVIAKIFRPGAEERAKGINDCVLALSEPEMDDNLENVLMEFSERHHNFETILLQNFAKINSLYTNTQGLSKKKKL